MVNTVRAFIQIFTRPNPAFERTAKFGLAGDELDADQAKLRRYQLDLDRIVFAEIALGAYCAYAAMLAWREGNLGVLVYTTVFSAGLLSIAAVSIAQAVGVARSRAQREAQIAVEGRAALEPTG